MRKGDDLTAFIVPKVMKNPEALTFRIPMILVRPVAGKLYFYLYFYGVRYVISKHGKAKIYKNLMSLVT